MTSALLFVALLVVVDLSYRRWARRAVARRASRERAQRTQREIVLDQPEASVIPMPVRRDPTHDGRRSG